MQATRTDLALEQAAALPKQDEIPITRRGSTFAVSEIRIADEAQGARIGRGIGRYVTLECRRLSHHSQEFREQAEELSAEISSFLPTGDILVVGLGNRDITPDALGPAVAGKIIATRHLRRELKETDPELAFLRALRPVSVLANGVLGQTGIEAAELAAALCDIIRPDAVIAVDALACSDLSRLGNTIQIADAGISPGSGVQNSRRELSRATLGVPVIAIGVPTVVDMHTILRGYNTIPAADLPNLMVTPRDIDKLIENAARLIGCALNLALQPQMSFHDVEGLS